MGRRRFLPCTRSSLLVQLQHLPHHHQQHNPHRDGAGGGHASSSDHNDHHHHHAFGSWKQTVARWRHGSSSADAEASSVTEVPPSQSEEDDPAAVSTDISSLEDEEEDSSTASFRSEEGAITTASEDADAADDVVVSASLVRRVSFGHCEIRTYEQVVGDHPSCSVGCPIQLGWAYREESSVRVDEHETAASSRGSSAAAAGNHRHGDLRLTPQERIAMLSASSRLSERDLLRECRRLNRAERTRRLNERNAKVFFSGGNNHRQQQHSVSATRKSAIGQRAEGEENSTPGGSAETEEIVME